ncbi:MAG: hypothetical protein V4736_04770 [Bdellovibrionota bacterium]
MAYGLFDTPPKQKELPAGNSNPPAIGKAHQEKINEHLHETSLAIELQREKQRMENLKAQAEAEKGETQSGTWEEASTGDSDRMNDLVNKLNRGENKKVDEASVENEIQNELYQDQKLREYDQAYRKAYIDQFIKNARQSGYEIKVDYQTLKILSVRQLRK